MSCKKYDRRFLNLAQQVSNWSKDPSTRVGAIIVDDDKRVVSMGYNGFARGVIDNKARLNNRDIKYKLTIHAELNAILFSDKSLVGCTIYTYPFMPCTACASVIIQSGISRIVSIETDIERWKSNLDLSRTIIAETGVSLAEYSKNFIKT